MAEGKLVVLWEADTQPRYWTWLVARYKHVSTFPYGYGSSEDGPIEGAQHWAPTDWYYVARDGREAEVYVPV